MPASKKAMNTSLQAPHRRSFRIRPVADPGAAEGVKEHRLGALVAHSQFGRGQSGQGAAQAVTGAVNHFGLIEEAEHLGGEQFAVKAFVGIEESAVDTAAQIATGGLDSGEISKEIGG